MPSALERGRPVSWGAGPNVVLPVFEAFQAARLEFATEVAKLSADMTQGNSAHGTYEVGGAEKLRAALDGSTTLADNILPLVNDLAPQVSESALFALGHLGALSNSLHEKTTQKTVLEAAIGIVNSSPSVALVRAAIFQLTVTAKRSLQSTQLAIDCGLLPALCERLDHADNTVRIATVWCLAVVADQSIDIAQLVVDSGVLQLLVVCLKDASIGLKCVSLSAIGSICKHNSTLADTVHKEGMIDITLSLLSNRDRLIRRHACRVLALACQHTEAATEWVPRDSRSALIESLRIVGSDYELATTIATLMHVLSKRSSSAATMLHEIGAVPVLIEYIVKQQGRALPACGAIEHICTASQDGAAVAFQHGAVRALVTVCAASEKPHISAVATAALGAICVQVEDAASQLERECAVQAVVHSTLLAVPPLGPKGLTEARKGVMKVIQACRSYDALVWIIEALPFPTEESHEGGEPLVTAVLFKRLGTLLAAQGFGQQRLDFVNRGALRRAQQAKSYRAAEPRDALKQLNSIFPPQVVAATDLNYEANLLEQLR